MSRHSPYLFKEELRENKKLIKDGPISWYYPYAMKEELRKTTNT
jgi:hypothetical protein